MSVSSSMLPTVFFIFYGIFMLAILAGYVLMVFIGWKIMKAHELLASSLKELAAVGKPKE